MWCSLCDVCMCVYVCVCAHVAIRSSEVSAQEASIGIAALARCPTSCHHASLAPRCSNSDCSEPLAQTSRDKPALPRKHHPPDHARRPGKCDAAPPPVRRGSTRRSATPARTGSWRAPRGRRWRPPSGGRATPWSARVGTSTGTEPRKRILFRAGRARACAYVSAVHPGPGRSLAGAS